jgi:hypothetical protein
MAILQDVSKNSLQAELDALRAENARLKAKAASRVPSLSVRVNALGTVNKQGEPCKGNIGVYGLGRYPVTLYKAQWLKLFDIVEDIRAAIDNAEPGDLAEKDQD